MSSFLIFSTSGALGYFLFNLLSHPKSTVKKRLPHLRLKWIQVMPNVRIHMKGRVIILHHWMNLTVIFVISIVASHGVLDLIPTKGLLVGGILQGLTYPDWKQIIDIKKDK